MVALGVIALGAVGLFSVLFWQDALELWHLSRFQSQDASVSSAAAEALVSLKSTRAIPVFLGITTSEKTCPFEEHARKILAALDDSAYERLASRLRYEPDELTLHVVKAAQAAGVERRRLLPILRRALGSANVYFCRWACEEIGEVGPDAVSLLPEIRSAQRSPDRLVSTWARIAEAKIDPSAPVVDLVKPQ